MSEVPSSVPLSEEETEAEERVCGLSKANSQFRAGWAGPGPELAHRPRSPSLRKAVLAANFPLPALPPQPPCPFVCCWSESLVLGLLTGFLPGASRVTDNRLPRGRFQCGSSPGGRRVPSCPTRGCKH